MNDNDPSSRRTWALGVIVFFYLIAVLVVAVAILLAVLPVASGPLIQTRLSTLSDEFRYVLLVASAAMLGSSLHALTSFVEFVGNRQLRPSWLLWYVYRALAAIPLALIAYFALRAGVVSPQTHVTELNAFGIAALSALVGMFSKSATDKLTEVASTLFGQGTRLENELGRISETLGATWLVNYRGYLCLIFQNEQGSRLPTSNDGTIKLLAGANCTLVAWFQPEPAKNADHKKIQVDGGIDSPNVEFHLNADSEKVSLRPRSLTIPFSVTDRSKEAKFEFKAPDNSDLFEIWIEVTQKNRFVDIVSRKIVAAEGSY